LELAALAMFFGCSTLSMLEKSSEVTAFRREDSLTEQGMNPVVPCRKQIEAAMITYFIG